MSLERKLRAWVESGVIDAATRDRIERFESARARPYALHAIGGLGALAVVLGVISLVASNWEAIPRLAKMALALVTVGAVAWGVHRADERGRVWPREVLLLLLHGLVLAAVALVGQTYNLGGKPWQALALWAALACPALLLLGASEMVALGAVAAADAALVGALAAWLARADLPEQLTAFAAVSAAGLLPLAHLALGTRSHLARWRPALARTLRELGWGALVTASLVAHHLWYAGSERLDADWRAGVRLAAAPIVGAALVLCRDLAAGSGGRSARLAPPALLLYGVVSALLPAVLPHPKLGVLAALSTLGLCVLLAWVGYARATPWLFNLATALIALRLVVVFVELFGSLFDTGVGLLTGGLLTLAVAWLWRRQARAFRQRMRSGEPS